MARLHQSWHHYCIAKGESMMFLTLEDLSGMLNEVLFPDAYRRAKDGIHGSAPLLVTGVVEMDSGREQPLLPAEKVRRLLRA